MAKSGNRRPFLRGLAFAGEKGNLGGEPFVGGGKTRNFFAVGKNT
jgi:hypothetical protein